MNNMNEQLLDLRSSPLYAENPLVAVAMFCERIGALATPVWLKRNLNQDMLDDLIEFSKDNKLVENVNENYLQDFLKPSLKGSNIKYDKRLKKNRAVHWIEYENEPNRYISTSSVEYRERFRE